MPQVSVILRHILRLTEVIKRTGKSRSAIYADMAKGLFPSSVRIGARSVGWFEDEVNMYVCSRPKTFIQQENHHETQ